MQGTCARTPLIFKKPSCPRVRSPSQPRRLVRSWRGTPRSQWNLVTPNALGRVQQHWRPTLRVEQQTENLERSDLGRHCKVVVDRRGTANDHAENPSAEVRCRIRTRNGPTPLEKNALQAGRRKPESSVILKPRVPVFKNCSVGLPRIRMT